MTQIYERSCPTCSKIIYHKSEYRWKKSKEFNRDCTSCIMIKRWSDSNSSIRSEKCRLKRNASLSRRRHDPNSGYNSKEYIKKCSESKKKQIEENPIYKSEEYRLKLSEASKKMWQSEEYRSKRLSEENLLKVKKGFENWMAENKPEFIKKLKSTWTKERRDKLREVAIERNVLWSVDPKITVVSKIEIRIKDYLESIGYKHSSVHQTRISRYLPDFINEETKTIVEVFGDYWHCNPNHSIFGKEDYYNYSTKKFAIEHWKSDDDRKKFLESQGYKVIVIWEKDIQEVNYDVSKLI